MEKISKNLFYGLYTCSLLSSVLNNTPPESLPEGVDLEELFVYQKNQSVANMAYCALRQLDIPLERLKNHSDEYKMMLLREARFELSGQQVFDALEKARIPYIPMKGVIIKKLFPQESLRSFTDYDIYTADKVEETKTVMESLGFEVKKVAQYDIGYVKKPSLHFEMHSELFEEEYNFGGYFDKPFERAVLKSGQCRYELTDEDFYIHVFCHLYKHFTFGGCGLRQFMDIYVLTKELKLDFQYIENEIEKLGLTGFYNTVNRINGLIFDGVKSKESDLEICEYIFSNGTFGTDKIIAVNEYNDTGENILWWKIKYFSNRWGLSYTGMKRQYPILKKLPILLPFCWVHKGLRVALFRRDVLKSQINDIEGYDSDYSEYLKHIWQISGVNR